MPSPANFIDANRPRGLTPDTQARGEGRRDSDSGILVVMSFTQPMAARGRSCFTQAAAIVATYRVPSVSEVVASQVSVRDLKTHLSE
jgi:hypothetical protein